jgi:hypothetical protein
VLKKKSKMPFEKRKSSDRPSERREQSDPLQKRARFSPRELSPNPVEHGLTHAAASSVGEATVAGALRRLGFNMPDQISHVSSMARPQDNIGRISDQLSMREKQPEISLQERERFQELQRTPRYQEGPLDLSTEKILIIAEEFKQEADQVGAACLNSCVKEKSLLFNELSKSCQEHRDNYKVSRDSLENQNSSNLEHLVKNLTEYQRAVVVLSQFTLSHLQETRQQPNSKLVQLVEHMGKTAIVNQKHKLQKLDHCCDLFERGQEKLGQLKREMEQITSKNMLNTAKTINYIKRDITVLGKIIMDDFNKDAIHAQRQQEIHDLHGKYITAMARYDALGEETKQLDQEERLKHARGKLLSMVEIVEEMISKYATFAKDVLKSCKKGKGLQEDHRQIDLHQDWQGRALPDNSPHPSLSNRDLDHFITDLCVRTDIIHQSVHEPEGFINQLPGQHMKQQQEKTIAIDQSLSQDSSSEKKHDEASSSRVVAEKVAHSFDLNELPDLNELLSDGEEINPNLHRDSFIRDQSKNAETGSEGDFYSSSSLSSHEINSSADEALGERKKPDLQYLVKAILDAIMAKKKCLPDTFDSETGDKLKSIFKTMKRNKEIKHDEYLKYLSIIKNSSDPHSIQKRAEKREYLENLRKRAEEGDKHAKELIYRYNDKNRKYWKNLHERAEGGDKHAKEQIDRRNAGSRKYWKICMK